MDRRRGTDTVRLAGVRDLITKKFVGLVGLITKKFVVIVRLSFGINIKNGINMRRFTEFYVQKQ